MPLCEIANMLKRRYFISALARPFKREGVIQGLCQFGAGYGAEKINGMRWRGFCFFPLNTRVIVS